VFFNKNHLVKKEFSSVRKGSIIIDTLLIGSLVLTISLYLLKLEFEEYKNVKSMKRYVTKADVNQENKEYLLTDFTVMIYNKSNEEGLSINKGSLKDLMTRRIDELKLWHNNSFIIYDKDKDCIFISSYFDKYYHREDFYDYSVENGKLKYSYVNTLYVLGRIKH